MDVDAYLRRIGCERPREPSLEALRLLQRAHMRAVPFENLDVRLGRPLCLDLAALYDKVVSGRRGGFCFEINGLFAWLLEQLGYRVALLSAQVTGGGTPSAEFDHLTLMIGSDPRLLVDVGFGASFQEPLSLETDAAQQGGDAVYRIHPAGDRMALETEAQIGDWRPQYLFSLASRRHEDFSGRCDFHQRSPDSPFTQKSLCTIATREGRVTLSGPRLIRTTACRREESVLSDEQEYREALRIHMGIRLPVNAPIERLMSPEAVWS